MDLMGELDLKSAFSDFEKEFGAIFTRSTRTVPIVCPLKQGDGLLEADYIQCFLTMLKGQSSNQKESKTKTKTHSIYDDLESLLYIILDAFSDRTWASSRRKKSAKLTVQPPGFTFYSSKVTALMWLLT
ncbi:hypothetical protein GGI17_002139 [Coemansia sp. S146]|nr:hypothetical protein GGI17_002139 [Coemansia sp. S146]